MSIIAQVSFKQFLSIIYQIIIFCHSLIRSALIRFCLSLRRLVLIWFSLTLFKSVLNLVLLLLLRSVLIRFYLYLTKPVLIRFCLPFFRSLLIRLSILDQISLSFLRFWHWKSRKDYPYLLIYLIIFQRINRIFFKCNYETNPCQPM